MRIDQAARRAGTPPQIHGARQLRQGRHRPLRGGTVAATCARQRKRALFAPGGKRFQVLNFTIDGGKIVQVDIIAEPERLRELDLAVLKG